MCVSPTSTSVTRPCSARRCSALYGIVSTVRLSYRKFCRIITANSAMTTCQMLKRLFSSKIVTEGCAAGRPGYGSSPPQTGPDGGVAGRVEQDQSATTVGTRDKHAIGEAAWRERG